MDEELMQVESKCPHCGGIDYFKISKSGFERRSRGVDMLAAYPDLPAHRLVQLATHACKSCQEKAARDPMPQHLAHVRKLKDHLRSMGR